jgi:hypothetical protein
MVDAARLRAQPTVHPARPREPSVVHHRMLNDG